ncbi:peptidase [Actinomadura sp. NBRC 104412]|uniref:M64 family metallopeptidase n=1 Tax=Actinomadura sp. NBRC 104412 TaxID=3032203 RepID=UPI0024A1EF44|nr:M64 family metallopeptidase [Actinomadura sp. NBRC 104412]GLZ08773.1 peptidase [Actinomadura sp. NBRC 104412]
MVTYMVRARRGQGRPRTTVVLTATLALPLATLTATGAWAGPARATTAESATVVPVQVTGDPAKRFNLVILGDGYTAADLPKFRAHVDRHLNDLWTIEPFKTYRSYVNVYAVEIVSDESGVSCDPDLSSPRRATPLKMAFWGGCREAGPQRLLTMDAGAARTYADLVSGTSDGNRQILALANSDTYGGAGGTYATASGGNALSALITPHELGHSLGGLDDEYDYYQRGVPGGTYEGGEPESIHHTLLTEREMREQRKKWWRWLGEPSEAGGRIGRYEGGLYFTKGVWRPSRHSIMKSLGYYFDQPARERMTQRISAKVDLIQDHTPTTAPVGDDRVLWLETMHPSGHALSVRWQLDGKDIRRARDARNLDLASLRLKPGTRHTVTATVTDPTAFVRDPAIRGSAALTRTRTWTVDTTVTTPPADVPVGFGDTTPTNRTVGAEEVVYAETTHPVRKIPRVRWEVDGRPVRVSGNDRDLDLGRLRLSSGTHRVTARVGDKTREWTIDAQRPTATYAVSRPSETRRRPGRPPEYVFDGSFTMRLTTADDRPGTVVGEFRVDGDGWYNYFGWPTDSSAPFLFTENGTVIDHLSYGGIGKGRHTIEYRAIDAAGNIGRAEKFIATLR